MPGNISWIAIDAIDLLDARDEGRLSDLLPASGGIYIWRRRLVAPSNCKTSSAEFKQWILELSEHPNARLPRRSLSHCVWSEGIQIGGGGLSEEKSKTLESIAGNTKLRRLVINYMESLSAFCPAIYIGEANDLRKRVKQHLNGETGLLDYLEHLLQLQWQDLQFQYFVTSKSTSVSEQAKAIQELLEMVAQRALAPFATVRPG